MASSRPGAPEAAVHAAAERQPGWRRQAAAERVRAASAHPPRVVRRPLALCGGVRLPPVDARPAPPPGAALPLPDVSPRPVAAILPGAALRPVAALPPVAVPPPDAARSPLAVSLRPAAAIRLAAALRPVAARSPLAASLQPAAALRALLRRRSCLSASALPRGPGR